MHASGIILAGGFSSRLGHDKGLQQLGGRPLIEHVLNSIQKVVDERIIVVGLESQAERYRKILGSDCRILVDSVELRGPVVGALAGLKAASNDHSFLLSCDTPFVSPAVLSLLSELCVKRNAVIPRWPNCYIEPLQAIYRTSPAVEASAKALCTGETNMQAMVNNLLGIRYISTLVIQQLDKNLKTFFNINTPLDLAKAEKMLTHQPEDKSHKG